MTKTLLENIEMVPGLPQTVQEIEKIYQDENSTIEDMQKVIEKDPLLTADILRILNSSLYSLKNNVTTIKQAISLLGKDAIRMFAMNGAINSFEINLSPYNMSAEEFTKACNRQLALAIHWVVRRHPQYLSILGPAAFLVDIGRVIIAKTLLDDDKAEIIKEAIAEGQEISEAEKSACGAQTTDVTATIFHKWNFDPNITHIIRYSDDPEGTALEDQEMAAILKAVRETVMPNGEITEESIAAAKETIEEFNLDLSSYERALEKVM